MSFLVECIRQSKKNAEHGSLMWLHQPSKKQKTI